MVDTSSLSLDGEIRVGSSPTTRTLNFLIKIRVSHYKYI